MKFFLGFFFFILSLHILQAQTPNFMDQHPIGFRISESYWDQPLPEGVTYNPSVRALYGSWMLPRKKDRIYRWYLMVEPQWNTVQVGNQQAREIGILPGLGIQLKVTNTTLLFGEGGAGIKFITAETQRQKRGFLFTDNFIGGVRQRLGKAPIEIQAHIRARHLSNASLRPPNKGINNFFWGFGLGYLLY